MKISEIIKSNRDKIMNSNLSDGMKGKLLILAFKADNEEARERQRYKNNCEHVGAEPQSPAISLPSVEPLDISVERLIATTSEDIRGECEEIMSSDLDDSMKKRLCELLANDYRVKSSDSKAIARNTDFLTSSKKKNGG